VAPQLLDLELAIDDVVLERRSVEIGEWTRATTTVHLRARGAEGLGEDVTYQSELHDGFPAPPVAGRWTVATFSEHLEQFDLFPVPPRDEAARDYRRWAWESAALDLALAQAGLTLAEAVGREPQPVRYVVSTRAQNVRPLLERYPDLRFKLDPAREWLEDGTLDDLASLGRVDTADYKGVYRGDFGFPPDPALYVRVADAFPEAWLEDPALVPETDRALGPYRDRITWDAPIHSWQDVERLPFEPRCLNVKPSRFGSVARLFEFYEECGRRGIALYGGGQFELGVGRLQIQELASLFHPDGPNDVAPGLFNLSAVPDDAPPSPLPPPRVFGTKS
jgi:hypothetical protein